MQISIDKIAVNLTRLLFIVLIIFELFNYFNIFNFDLDFTWLGLILTSTLIWTGLEIIQYLIKKQSNSILHFIVWPITVFAVYFDALGDIFHFYSRYTWYDQVAHFIGSAAASVVIFFILQTLSERSKYKKSVKSNYFLMAFFVITLGVIYEFEEYLEDYFNLTNRFGDIMDTINDMFFNILGILIVILTLLFIPKKRNDC